MCAEVSNRKSVSNGAISYMNKQLSIELTQAAQRALKSLQQPLLIEMELYFGCLIRKQVRFHKHDKAKRFQRVTDDISLAFRPVVTLVCSLDEVETPPVEDIDIPHKQAYIPKWLRIHYRRGSWEGTFGY